MVMDWWFYSVAFLLAPLAIAFGWRWIWAPIRIWRKHVMKGGREWEPTTAERLSPEMAEFVGHAVARFGHVGFGVVFNGRRAGGATNVLDSHIVLFINRHSNDTATAIIVRTSRTRSMVLQISSRFRDGRRLVTRSRQQVGFMSRDPLTDAANFPKISDPALLWAAHQRRLRFTSRDSEERTAPEVGGEESYLNEMEERERSRMVECGYFRRMQSGDYRPTWKGAFLMSWKLMEPVKRWRIRLQQWKADQLWRDLEMNSAMTSETAIRPARCEEPLARVAPRADAPAIRLPAMQLPYDVVLMPGEIRESWDGPVLTMRIAQPNMGQILAGRWFSVLYLIFVLVMLGWTTYRTWVFWQMAKLWPGMVRYPLVSPFLYLWGLLSAWEIWSLARSLSRARGTVVLVSSEAGLRYTNAVGRPHSGFIPRREFHSFKLAIETLGFTKRTYRIEARFTDGRRPVALAVNADLPAIETALRSLASAIGLSTSY